MTIRRDLAHPFHLVGGQAAVAPYAAHVAQMVRQVLLTDPGERVCLPTFGAGLRRLLFAPIGVGLDSATDLAVRQALDTWLGDQITVVKVAVTVPEESRIDIEVTYELIETREQNSVGVELRP
jgi:phage baseplate assembly protein W